MANWKCACCGNCCEILSEFVFGEQCKGFNKETRLCDVYAKRPVICNTKFAGFLQRLGVYLKDVPLDDYLIARCKLVQHLKKWKEECGDMPEATKVILKAFMFGKMD